MATVDLVAVPVESTHVVFHDLTLGSCRQEVLCRLLRFWDSRNIKRDNEFMGITMLLLDEQNSLIHGFIPSALADDFRPLLREGLIYRLASFDVGQCTKMYKITDSPFVIRFMDYTSITPVQPSISIEPMKFLLRNVEHLQALANTNLELPDVVGQVRFFQGSNLTDPTSQQRLVVRLRVAKDITICLSLWDDAAATYRSHLCGENKINSVMIVTTVNPKLSGGKLFLNSTPATRFYFDPAIDAIKKFKESMGINGDTEFNQVDTTQMVNKVETVTISELEAYISKPAEQVQDAEFSCKAKVHRVLKTNGWSYIACGSCSRKLDKIGSALRCNKCASSRVTGIVRYRVELSVEDKSGAATFVVFDTEMTKLLSKTAATLTLEARDEADTNLPQCLQGFAGKTYLFNIRVSPFNFTNNHRNFTVTTMAETDPEEEEIAPAMEPLNDKQQHREIKDGENVEAPRVPPVLPSEEIGKGCVEREGKVSLLRELDTAKRIANKTDATAQCSICLEDVGRTEQINNLKCGHIFHSLCIITWLYSQIICPICRSEDI